MQFIKLSAKNMDNLFIELRYFWFLNLVASFKTENIRRSNKEFRIEPYFLYMYRMWKSLMNCNIWMI